MKKPRPTTKKLDRVNKPVYNPFHGCVTPSEVQARYRTLARKAHPDAGGSHEAFVALTAARDRALETEIDCDLIEMGLERWPG